MASSTDLATDRPTRYSSAEEVLEAAAEMDTNDDLWAAVQVSKGCTPVYIKLVRSPCGYCLEPCSDYFTIDLNSWLSRMKISASQLMVDVVDRRLTLLAPNGQIRTLGEKIIGWYIVRREEIRHFNPGN